MGRVDEGELRACLPELFTAARWGPVEAVFEHAFEPPLHLVANANVVPFCGDRTLVPRLADGHPELPGGTLEPGEGYLDAIRRELREEAGAHLLTFTLLGAWRCRSAATEPHRPHLPHPAFYRVVGFGDVELVGPPGNPAGGEHVVSVDLLPPAAAAALFRRWLRPELAAIYQLAELCRRG